MTQLLVDIGNTRIKYTRYPQPFVIHYNTHQQHETLISFIQTNNINRLCLTTGRSSQAQQTLTALIEWSQTKLYEIDINIVRVNQQLIDINYTKPEQFGVDRFLNLLAAKARYQKNFCVISCGTAITLDFYSNRHLGGMILLGLGASIDLLAQKTNLKTIKKPQEKLGNDTASSIGAGLYLGYKNLISCSIIDIEKTYNLSFQRVFTGGDGQLLLAEGEMIETLLFEGMSIYLDDR